jgi:cytochrome c-type biogenesis protein CcmH
MVKRTPATFLLTILLLLTIATTFLRFSSVHAQQSTPSDDEVNEIARQLFCPICENTPLDVCPTDACREWRELIRQMLAQSKTPNEIKQYFVNHYGARVLSEPPRIGLYWLVYVVPPLALLIGIFLLFRAFRVWNKKPKEISAGEDSSSKPFNEDEYASRLEEELRKRK